MQRKRQFHDAEVRAQGSPGGSTLMNQELADLACKVAELLLGKVLQISGPADLFQHSVSLRSGCDSGSGKRLANSTVGLRGPEQCHQGVPEFGICQDDELVVR